MQHQSSPTSLDITALCDSITPGSFIASVPELVLREMGVYKQMAIAINKLSECNIPDHAKKIINNINPAFYICPIAITTISVEAMPEELSAQIIVHSSNMQPMYVVAFGDNSLHYIIEEVLPYCTTIATIANVFKKCVDELSNADN